MMTELVEKRPLGRTPIEITPIGLGAWQFSEGRGGARGSWSPVGSEETDAIVVVVSEETARISVARGGRIEVGLDEARLRELLSDGA